MPGDRDASGEKRGAPRRSWRGSDRRHHPGGDQCDLRCHRQAHPHPADRYGTAEILTLITKEALMLNLSRYGLAISLLAAGAVSPEAAQVAALKPVAAFSTIRDERARSVALLTEAARVIQSPRCLNCHPVNRQPTQGDDLHAHVPLMYAGPGDHGVAGLQCKSCHGMRTSRRWRPPLQAFRVSRTGVSLQLPWPGKGNRCA